MRRRYALQFRAAALVLLPLLGALGSSDGAQTIAGAGVADLPPEVRPASAAWLDAVVREILLAEGLLLFLVVLELGLVVAGMEAFDWWRDRKAGEAARLRGLIASALQRDRLLKDLAVTPVVHLPLWRRSWARVELRGQVPAHWLREAVLRTAALEASKSLAVCRIDDRLVIGPSGEARAA